MKTQFTYPFFSHKDLKSVLLTPAIKAELGDYPTVKTLIYDEEGKISPQELPVTYVTNDYDETISVIVKTGNKNGLIILE